MVTTVLGADGVLLPYSGATTHGIVGSKAAELFNGTTANDSFRGGGGGDTLIGGLGDDTYNIYDAKDTAIEQANAGIDTIAATVSYWLPANVENITVTTDLTYGGGNSLNNILTGGNGRQTLDGKGGYDVMTGGAGADIYVLGSGYGHDVVTDFQTGVDMARLWGLGFTSFAQVQAAMSQLGADVKLTAASGDQLIFRNHQVSDFTQQDFQLGLNFSRLTPTFDDEFNTLSLYSQGGTWWTAMGGNNALINHTLQQNGEAEIYVDPLFPGTGTTPLGLNPFSINNGVLSITANVATPAVSSQIWNYQYTSGMLNTKTTFNQKYGYFEFSAKFPAGNGLWPALWMVPAWNSGFNSEIDVLEQVGRDPYTVWQTTHSTTTSHNNPSVAVHIDNPDQFHTYGMMWDQNWIVWYVDGVETSRRPTLSDQQTAMYLILNLAVGGYWAGYPDATTPFPATMQVDYVRAYQLQGSGIVAGADSYTVGANTPLSASAGTGVIANDSNPSGQAFTAMLLTGPSHGTLSFSASGAFTYTPTAGYTGADSFVYRDDDGMQQSSDTTVSLTVGSTSTNVAPTAATSSASGNEDTAITGQVSATDPDSASLTYAVVAGPQHGSVSLGANGAYTYTPGANYNGSDSFTFQANDGLANSNIATVSLTIAAVNDAPVAAAGTGSGAQGAVISGQLSATDVDSASLTYSLATGPQHGSVTVNANGTYQYTPTAGYTGADSFSFKASDGSLSSNTAAVSLTISAVNQAPVATSTSASGAEDGVINGQASASDVNSPVLTYSLVTGPQHGALTFNADGSYQYAPAANYNGADSFSFKASDGSLSSNTATVSLTVTAVNDAPTAAASSASGAEDTAISGQVSATDVDSATLTYAVSTGPQHGSLVLNANGSYQYTPVANYNGADSFSFTASDGSLTSIPASVSLTVTPVNDPPVANTDSASVTTGSSLSFPVATLLANDTDVDGNVLTVTGVAMGANPHGTVQLVNGVVTYTPTAGYTGADSFTYYVSDGVIASPVAGTVNVSVTTATSTYTSGSAGPDVFDFSTRTGPQLIAGNDGDDTITGGMAADTINGGVGNDVLRGGPGGDALTGGTGADRFVFTASDFSATTLDSITDFQGVGNGAVAGDDQIVFDGFSASATVTLISVSNAKHTFELTDGAFHGRFVVSYAGSVVLVPGDFVFVNVSGNQPPASTADIYSATEDTPLAVAAGSGVLANDSDPNSQALSASLVSGPNHGVLSLAADGSFSYTPDANYSGADSFTYLASDGTLSGPATTVSLTVAAVNDAPVAASGSASGNEDTAISGQVSASDIDSPSLTYSLVSAPQHGTITFNADGTYLYTPAPNYNGPDSFSFTANDGSAVSNTATVSLTVTPTNHAPVATPDTLQMAEGTVLSIPVLSLLANDTDADGDALTITSVALGATPHGTVSLANGVITYTPDVGFHNWDTFTYYVSDGHAAPVAGTVSVAVTTTTTSYINGTAGDDTYDFSLRTGPQLVNAQAGDDTVLGGIVGDTINGSVGNDVLFGNGGADSLTGGAGTDTVNGGAGADTFIFSATGDFGPAGSEDVITDFKSSDGDRISLSLIDANPNVSGNQAFSFLGTSAFTNAPGQLHYVASGPDLIVSGDINGDGVADFQFKVLGVSSLQASDFIL